MAQSAVSAIRAGCQMLSEGKAEIGKFKKQVEGGVADAKAIFKEVTGIWKWIQSLLGTPKKLSGNSKPVQTLQPTLSLTAAPQTKKNKREPEPELSYEEFQARAVHEICENLKVYFEAVRHLKAHCRELEKEALITEKVADSAIDRIEMQWQMKGEYLYNLYKDLIPQQYKYLKYIKAKNKKEHKADQVEAVATYYEISKSEAKEYIDMLSKEEIENIILQING